MTGEREGRYLFSYRGVHDDGEECSGELAADSREQAVEALGERGITPFELVMQRELSGGRERDAESAAGSGGTSALRTAFSSPLGLGQLVLFARKLSALLEAGLDIGRALETLAEQRTSARLSRVVEALRDEVTSGNRLSSALGDHRQYFSPLFIRLVEIGERTGELPKMLAQLAEMLERERYYKSKLKQALIYPAILFGLMFGMALLFRYLGFPGFEIFLWLIPAIFGAALGLNLLARSKTVAFRLRDWISRIPGIGTLMRQMAISRSLAALATLWSAGAPLLEALELTAESSWLPSIRRAWFTVKDSVADGEPLAAGMEASEAFPRDVINVVKSGEESATVDRALDSAHGYLEDEIEAKTQNFMKLLGPVVLVVMGAFVLYFLVEFWNSYFQRIFSIAGG